MLGDPVEELDVDVLGQRRRQHEALLRVRVKVRVRVRVGVGVRVRARVRVRVRVRVSLLRGVGRLDPLAATLELPVAQHEAQLVARAAEQRPG